MDPGGSSLKTLPLPPRRRRRTAWSAGGPLPAIGVAVGLALFTKSGQFPQSFLGWGFSDDFGEPEEVEPEEKGGVILGLGPFEVTGYVLFAFSFQLMRTLGKRYEQSRIGGERLLSLPSLNEAVMFKEVFLAYLNAAILEPVLTIAGDEPVLTAAGLAVNFAMLAAIGWWILILTDAFDISDVQSAFAWRNLDSEAKKDPGKYSWFKLDKSKIGSERRKLVGSVYYDMGLWFVLGAICGALVGSVRHRAVFHAWMLLGLWAVQHHKCIGVTNWGASYIVSFFLPSATLVPLEFCLPLAEVNSLEELAEWRQFIEDCTKVKLIIEH